MSNFISNNRGAAIYKQVMIVIVVIAIIVFILLLKRSGDVKEQGLEKTAEFEQRAQEAGIDLEEFK